MNAVVPPPVCAAEAAWRESLALAAFLRDARGGQELFADLAEQFPTISRSGVFFAISIAWSKRWAVLAAAKRDLEIAELEILHLRREVEALRGSGDG